MNCSWKWIADWKWIVGWKLGWSANCWMSQSKFYPTIHFRSTIHFQLQFTCTWSEPIWAMICIFAMKYGPRMWGILGEGGWYASQLYFEANKCLNSNFFPTIIGYKNIPIRCRVQVLTDNICKICLSSVSIFIQHCYIQLLLPS